MRPIRGPDGRVWGSRRQLLTQEQEQAARDAWAAGLRRDHVAAAAGITVARLVARLKMAELPRNANPTRVRNRCATTGRPRGYYRKFGINRIELRQLGNSGMIPGLTKSSW